MKYMVVVADGMADYPVEELGGRTPLEAARTPYMDRIAREGAVGRVRTIPPKLSPASDVANICILGYDPREYYTGRGPLEAAYLGVDLAEGDMAFRCNLVTVANDTMVDYSAGHIRTEEAAKIISSINSALGNDRVSFYPGVSYRHLMKVKGGVELGLAEVKCTPPHDITGKPLAKHLPKGKAADFLLQLMEGSLKVLSAHEINQVRIDLGENPANMIWLWGQGAKPMMPTFQEKFGVKGSMISAVDLLRGLGKILGLEVVHVEGATGYYDTNYAGKAEAALKALQKQDFVFVHIEAPDEAGHNGDLREKINAIERIDQMILGPAMEAFKGRDDFKLLVLPDHATPVSVRTHTSDPVFFGIYGAGIAPSGTPAFSEKEAAHSALSFEKGHELMGYFITGASPS
jgi:2,3-bisphosphoglycerate-independent phosphoglycerate mutase